MASHQQKRLPVLEIGKSMVKATADLLYDNVFSLSPHVVEGPRELLGDSFLAAPHYM